jgi:DNA-binding IscR family transcriptional regulator
MTPDDLSPAERAVLDMLQDGRVTAPYAAAETGYSLQYVRDVLTSLRRHGHVERVHDGLYELAADPRDEPTTDK